MSEWYEICSQHKSWYAKPLRNAASACCNCGRSCPTAAPQPTLPAHQPFISPDLIAPGNPPLGGGAVDERQLDEVQLYILARVLNAVRAHAGGALQRHLDRTCSRQGSEWGADGGRLMAATSVGGGTGLWKAGGRRACQLTSEICPSDLNHHFPQQRHSNSLHQPATHTPINRVLVCLRTVGPHRHIDGDIHVAAALVAVPDAQTKVPLRLTDGEGAWGENGVW